MKLTKYRLYILFLGLLALLPKAGAQTLIEVRLDTADIFIGEQTTLHLTITTGNGKQILRPLPEGYLMPGVEILSVSKPDSAIVDNRLTIKQDILITSFDSALYLLPPFIAIDGQDTVRSGEVALKVTTLPVDVSKPEEFFDIKDIWIPPFVLADYYPLIFGIVAGLILLLLICFILIRLLTRKPLTPFRRETPALPPYDEAIQGLDRIRQQKLWQQGRSKEYHTMLTDTLRHYLCRRYGFNAMEMTSPEIMDALRTNDRDRELHDILNQILRLADFVKFAKLHPLPDENDLSLSNAYTFVYRTKPEEAPAPESQTQDSAPQEGGES